ncbi:MAG: YigZ family protein [Ruminiclostridium sp.]|nr:YigZ family protein [Ruminiclostridium sp.]
MSYKTIRNRCEASFIEKKSEFIGYLCPVTTEQEATDFINEIRAMHRKATHNCYAYILRDNNTARHSDDGEPGGTAGVPIYDVLNKTGVTDIACVVTRYFGGIMLGAGGLVRAYSKGASIALEAADIMTMEIADSLKITADYTYYGNITAIASEYEAIIRNTEYTDNVSVFLDVKSELTDKLKEKLIDKCNGRVEIEFLDKGYKEF